MIKNWSDKSSLHEKLKAHKGWDVKERWEVLKNWGVINSWEEMESWGGKPLNSTTFQLFSVLCLDRWKDDEWVLRDLTK